jgi:hypothetical protein
VAGVVIVLGKSGEAEGEHQGKQQAHGGSLDE